VACLYLLILLAITCPVIALAWYPRTSLADAAAVYLWWPYWVMMAVLFLCQVALVVVPVGVLTRRPVTRRPLILPVVASGLMMTVLVVAAFLTLLEVWWLTGADGGRDDTPSAAVIELGGRVYEGKLSLGDLLLVLVLPGALWVGWAMVFYQLSRRRSMAGAVAMQSRTLLTGSILELLVAIPTHIAARQRTECCAGFNSFWGLSLGMSVMLFAFGPGVFFLFLARWRRLHARRDGNGPMPVKFAEEPPADAWQGPTSW
jgi:hypothetical protein